MNLNIKEPGRGSIILAQGKHSGAPVIASPDSIGTRNDGHYLRMSGFEIRAFKLSHLLTHCWRRYLSVPQQTTALKSFGLLMN